MASRSSILAVKVLVDAKDAKELDTVASKVDKVGDSAAKWAKGALGAVALGSLGKAAVDAASNLEQAGGAVDAVFKSNATAVHGFAESASSDLGMSESSYLSLASTIGAQLKNAGTSMDDLAPKTDELIGLGADLAAQFGGTAADAVSALSSLLRGERDPIERFGVSISQAAVDSQILAMGLDTSTEAAKKASTQTATLALLYEQTADAQGAAAREADTYAGTQARMQAVLEDTAAAVGTALLPAMSGLMDLVADLAPVVGDLLTPVAGLATALLDLPGPLLAVVAGAAGWMMFGGKITTSLSTFVTKIGDTIKSSGGLKTALGGIVKSAAGGLGVGAVLGAITAGISAAVERSQMWAAAFDQLDASAESLADSFRDAGSVWNAQSTTALVATVEQTDAYKALREAGLSGADALVYLGAVQGDLADVQERNYAALHQLGNGFEEPLSPMLQLVDGTRHLATDTEQLVKDQDAAAASAEALAYAHMTAAERTAAFAEKTGGLLDAIDTARGAFLDAKDAAGGMADQLSEVDRQAKLAGDEAKLLGATIDELTGRDTGLEGAIVGWEAGLDDLADSFVAAREAGEDHTAALAAWDVKALAATQTGRDLYTATSDQAAAYDEVVAGTYSTVAATGDLAGAEDAARKSADDARAEFIDMMTAQLGSRDAAVKLADKLGIVDGIDIDDKYFETSTDTRKASDDIEALNDQQLHDKTVEAHANMDQARHDLNEWINQQRHINVTVNAVPGFGSSQLPGGASVRFGANSAPQLLGPSTTAALPAVTGTGITINVTGALDPAAVGRQIRDLIRGDERRSGSVRLVGAR